MSQEKASEVNTRDARKNRRLPLCFSFLTPPVRLSEIKTAKRRKKRMAKLRG